MFRCTVIAFILISGTIQNSSGQTHVQTETEFQTTTASTIAVTFGGASTTGNLIVVHLDWDGQNRNVKSVTDNKGNSYARINGPTNWNGTNYRAELWYAYNITGAAAIKVTAKLSGAPTSFSQMYITEYSGILTVDPLDQNSVATGNSAAVSSGSKTITYNHELVYGASIGAAGILSTGAGYTNRSAVNSNIIEDKKAAAVGSYNAAFTNAGGNWIAQMATFITTSSLIVLPIDLLSFTGQCNQGHVVLAWTTASEMNNDYFTIERSADGTGWETIGTIKSAGNSSVSQNYSFTTDETNDRVSYFRLKQTDLDGKFKYFNTLQVNNCFKDDMGLNIYPNPSNGRTLFGRLNLKASEPYTVEIFDNLGKMISRLVSGQSEFTVNFQQTLPSGVYFVKISSTGFSAVKCFLVSH